MKSLINHRLILLLTCLFFLSGCQSARLSESKQREQATVQLAVGTERRAHLPGPPEAGEASQEQPVTGANPDWALLWLNERGERERTEAIAADMVEATEQTRLAAEAVLLRSRALEALLQEQGLLLEATLARLETATDEWP
jgi:hypothetical protein